MVPGRDIVSGNIKTAITFRPAVRVDQQQKTVRYSRSAERPRLLRVRCRGRLRRFWRFLARKPFVKFETCHRHDKNGDKRLSGSHVAPLSPSDRLPVWPNRPTAHHGRHLEQRRRLHTTSASPQVSSYYWYIYVFGLDTTLFFCAYSKILYIRNLRIVHIICG